MRTEERSDRLTAMFQAHHNQVLAYCTRRVGRSEADDAAAEVFSVAWRRIDELDDEYPLPWLYAVARRVVANTRRSRFRRLRLVDRVAGLAESAHDRPEDVTVRHEDDDRAMAALHQLRPADREVLMLAAWERLTAREIAVVIDVSEAAAAQRLHRAKQRFAEALEKAGVAGGTR